MKKMWILLIIILIIIAITLIVIFLRKNKEEINSLTIKSMYFSYSTGTMINSNASYEINYKDDKYIATIKPDQRKEEAKLTVELDEKTIEKITNILNENNILSWDGFNKHDKYVLDGDGFSFNLKTQSNKEIKASGYMKYPKNYSKVSGSLTGIFDELYDKYYIYDLDYLSFNYSNGYEINSRVNYKIEKKDDKYIVTVKPDKKSDEEERKIEVYEDFIEDIEIVLNKYDISNWDGFSESDKNVLDGDSFSFSIKYKNKKITASGYEKWPKNYRNVKEELDKLFLELYDEEVIKK